ncbi:hypothetical protein ACOME3_010405 [Neoechinorhynchus agilis]
MPVECQDVKFKESRNLCTTHDILHNLPIKQSLRKMICSATVRHKHCARKPIPNTTDDDQEDIADENSLEDLHSDSSNDWSGMDNCDDQTHRTIPSSYIDYVVIAETSTAIDCSSKDWQLFRWNYRRKNAIRRQLGKMLSSSEKYDGKYIEVTELKPPDALSTPRSYERTHISWIRLMKQKEEDDKHTDWSHDTKKCRDYDWRTFQQRCK